MNRIVDQVSSKRFDGKRCFVTTSPGASPSDRSHRFEGVGERARSGREVERNDMGRLPVIGPDDRRLVLVPVRVQRIVEGQHEAKPLKIQIKNITNVCAIFEVTPTVGPPMCSQLGLVTFKQGDPSPGVETDREPDLRWIELGRHKPALRARLLEDPSPVLFVVFGNCCFAHVDEGTDPHKCASSPSGHTPTNPGHTTALIPLTEQPAQK
ncbi:MAG: hypothetical protein ACJAXA_001054 [Candidatus Aldehydirespiratoraceae bacterium]|jgi:hypothetical protein